MELQRTQLYRKDRSSQQPGLRRKRRTQYLPMSEAESWLFIREHYKMVLCTLDSFGLPHAAPVWYVVIGKKIYFRAQPYKRKISNLLRRSEIAAVVEDGDKYTELRGVMIRGIGNIIDSDKILRKQVFDLLAEKYEPLRDTDRFPKLWQEKFGKEHRLVVEISPTSIVSWDNRKWLTPNSAKKI